MIVARSEDMRQPGHIGYGAGAVTWVVDPENAAMLSPVGCVGELWLEGPLVGRGYLNDPERTVASFIEDPAWLLHKAPGHPGRRGRLYRTGDLVRYEEDGSLIFLGRKDGQVKVRGQRVELGEIEYHLRRQLNDSEAIGEPQVVAEVVTPYGLPRAMLVAFVVPLGAASMTEDDLHSTVASLTRDMDDRLPVPQYMIPSLYVPLREIPTTQTGKKDRRALRELGASIKLDNSRSKKDVVAPSNEVERTLREIWGHVLNTPVSSISVEATFSRLGGGVYRPDTRQEPRANNFQIPLPACMSSPGVETAVSHFRSAICSSFKQSGVSPDDASPCHTWARVMVRYPKLWRPASRCRRSKNGTSNASLKPTSALMCIA